MEHIRRKFVDVHKSLGSAIAEQAIKHIAALYGIEKEGRGRPSEERATLRQQKAKTERSDVLSRQERVDFCTRIQFRWHQFFPVSEFLNRLTGSLKGFL